MKKFILVDTSVWSEVLRKRHINEELSFRMRELLEDDSVVMIGPIRQEILSGIKDEKTFNRLLIALRCLSDFRITTEDYEIASKFYNTCRGHGIQGSHIDFLIAAVAFNNNFDILTTDKDFELYSKYIPITLV